MARVIGSADQARQLRADLMKAAQTIESQMDILESANRRIAQAWTDDSGNTIEEILASIRLVMNAVQPDLLDVMRGLDAYAAFLDQPDWDPGPCFPGTGTGNGFAPQPAGRRLADTFRLDYNDSRSALEQVAAKMGTNTAPMLVDRMGLQTLVQQNKMILFRSLRDVSGSGITKEEIADATLHKDGISYNAKGGTVYGQGLYFVSNGDFPNGVSEATARSAQAESFCYGSLQMAATVDVENAQFITETEANELWSKVPAADKARFGGERNAYLAAIGKDFLLCKNAGGSSDYLVVLNRSKLVMYNETITAPPLGRQPNAGTTNRGLFARLFRRGKG